MRKIGVLLFLVLFFLFSFSRKHALTSYTFPKLQFFPEMPIAVDNPVTVEGARLGRYLFYDPILSADSSMSCASCHQQKQAFSDAPLQFSRGRNNVPLRRNTMPLFNLAWYPAFFWDGRATSLEEQVFHPVRAYNEMNLNWNQAAHRLQGNKFYRKQFKLVFGHVNIDSTHISKAIAQFMRTLISYQSKYDQVIAGKVLFTKDEYEGFGLVNDQTKGDCIHCHSTDGNALGTKLLFTNNGLDAVLNAKDFKDPGRGGVSGKQEDNGKFIVPSLRNLAFTAPYMHDGRFKTLEEVLQFYSSGVKLSATIDSKMEYAHQGGVRLSPEESRKIIAFLMTMSDSTFVSNPAFSNPFAKTDK